MTVSGIGELIRELRRQRGWSIDETAAALASPPSYLACLESGADVLPTYELLRRLRDVGIPMLDLMQALGVITMADLARLEDNVYVMDALTLAGDGELDSSSIGAYRRIILTFMGRGGDEGLI
ncbi:MAG: helix-turn-helix transcriptional regulator [Chloroflexi bacterium]|nr:helix-turn-helix transcriptional regulator [Chloroflexota bacterium]